MIISRIEKVSNAVSDASRRILYTQSHINPNHKKQRIRLTIFTDHDVWDFRLWNNFIIQIMIKKIHTRKNAQVQLFKTIFQIEFES